MVVFRSRAPERRRRRRALSLAAQDGVWGSVGAHPAGVGHTGDVLVGRALSFVMAVREVAAARGPVVAPVEPHRASGAPQGRWRFGAQSGVEGGALDAVANEVMIRRALHLR